MKKKKILHFIRCLFFLSCSNYTTNAQNLADSISPRRWYDFHYQSTVITQQHPGFHAKYSGKNSLDSTSEFHSSISMTLYFAARVWKSSSIYFDPELSGGEGFSQTTGVAGFPNGEVYRVSDPKPHIYVARLYFMQIFPLYDANQTAEFGYSTMQAFLPKDYLAIEIGRFSLMDFYDNNLFSHDPRTQFYNWALMGNGAWDYAANTRGYTYGVNFELVKQGWALRFALVAVPKVANGSDMELNLLKAGSECLEFTKNYGLGTKQGALRLVAFFNKANMGSYKNALAWGIANSESPNVDSVAGSGKTKFGFGLNIEQKLSKNLGWFIRAGWNDGKNETWVFTEIDKSFTTGFSIDGTAWNRKEDNMGVAQIINGLSPNHRTYLTAGGYGFLIGDGQLNYGMECITEFYYSFILKNSHMALSPDYQLIINPAYNKDRGPVHSFGMRMHVEF